MDKYKDQVTIECLSNLSLDWKNKNILNLLSDNLSSNFKQSLSIILEPIKQYSEYCAIEIEILMTQLYLSLHNGGIVASDGIKAFSDPQDSEFIFRDAHLNSNAYYSKLSVAKLIELTGMEHSHLVASMRRNHTVGILKPISGLLAFSPKDLLDNNFCLRNGAASDDFKPTRILLESTERKLREISEKYNIVLERKRANSNGQINRAQHFYLDLIRMTFAYTIIERDGTKNKEP